MSENSNNKHGRAAPLHFKLKIYTDPGQACSSTCWDQKFKKCIHPLKSSCNLHDMQVPAAERIKNFFTDIWLQHITLIYRLQDIVKKMFYFMWDGGLRMKLGIKQGLTKKFKTQDTYKEGSFIVSLTALVDLDIKISYFIRKHCTDISHNKMWLHIENVKKKQQQP